MAIFCVFVNYSWTVQENENKNQTLKTNIAKYTQRTIFHVFHALVSLRKKKTSDRRKDIFYVCSHVCTYENCTYIYERSSYSNINGMRVLYFPVHGIRHEKNCLFPYGTRTDVLENFIPYFCHHRSHHVVSTCFDTARYDDAYIWGWWKTQKKKEEKMFVAYLLQYYYFASRYLYTLYNSGVDYLFL